MYFDLNVPIPPITRKGKQKGPVFLASQLEEMESRIDLLIHLGYTVIGLSQTVQKRVEKTHINDLDTLLPALRKRNGILYLKRLNIILDQDSEKGFGLINASIPLFDTYDIIALIPTTHATFSLACLTHSQPSSLTAHIIALPLTLPRLPFHMKHTLVRTAIKNGSVFEINYVGVLGGEHDAVTMEAGAAESGVTAKRNWWATSRELVRVSKGKGLLLSGGVASSGDLRAPRDIRNLVTMLGLPQDVAHALATNNAKSLILRAQTRKTYRAVFSEPRLVIPKSNDNIAESSTREVVMKDEPITGIPTPSEDPSNPAPTSKKRTREDGSVDPSSTVIDPKTANNDPTEKQGRKKKRKRNRGSEAIS